MDIVSRETRSRMMSGIKGRNTRPEILVRSLLHRIGFRFRLHKRGLPGCPDILLPKYRAVIFIHGCFWHQHQDCKYATLPSSNPEFWVEKLNKNVVRDAKNIDALIANRWRVLVVWECLTRSQKESEYLAEALEVWIRGTDTFAELPEHRPSPPDPSPSKRSQTQAVV